MGLSKIILITSLFFSNQSFACTTFAYLQNQNRIVANSYDWDQSQGYVFVNKRNVLKQSAVFKPTDILHQWISKYASLTLNQIGRELPNAGINEVGLVVEVMWLESTVYPAPDQKPSVNELQWIQYMLDNAGSVAEAVQLANTIRISSVGGPIHYMICDVKAECATFEYINGQLEIHSDKKMVVNVLTNNTYHDSVSELPRYVGFGGTDMIPTDVSSLSRFVRAASKLQGMLDIPQAISKQIFTILDSVKNPATDGTQWQVMFDMNEKSLKWRTRDNPDYKTVGLNSFDLSCGDDVKMLNLQQSNPGAKDLEFYNYSKQDNYDLVKLSLENLGPEVIPPALLPKLIQAVSAYPDSTQCQTRLIRD